MTKKTTAKKTTSNAATAANKRADIIAITQATKRDMIARQGGTCRGCKEHFKDDKDACVDYCPKYGFVRSILCQDCLNLTHALEDPVLMAYFRKTRPHLAHLYPQPAKTAATAPSKDDENDAQ